MNLPYKLLFAIGSIVAAVQSTVVAQTNFIITPAAALQVSVPGQESYRYQVSASSDLTNWTPVTDLQTSCGGTETFSFLMTNNPGLFYRAEELPPDLTARMVGLTNVFFDNAQFQCQGPTITVLGFRAQSRDYTLNDYLTANFQFDFCKQGFSLSGLQVTTNLGVVCGLSPHYFMKNVTNALTMTNGAIVMNENTSYSLTTTGGVVRATPSRYC